MTGAPYGCARCWPEDVEAAWQARGSLARTAELIDDTHLGVALSACRSCHQQFVSAFVEYVDWVDGDDPQYSTLMPITDVEAADLVAHQGPMVGARVEALDPARRSLKMDYPKGEPKRIYWGTGISLR